MLIRAAIFWAVLCVCCLVRTGIAVADTRPVVPVIVAGDTKDGAVSTTVNAPGGPVAAARPVGAMASDSGRGVHCAWRVEGCSPAATHDTGTQGTWYDVRCSDGTAVPLGVFVPAGGGNVPPAVMLPGDLARSAANRLQLPQPLVRHSPAAQALVGLPTWFWVEPAQWRLLRQRTAAGPVWAEVTATPIGTAWDPGDGSPALSCAGPGTPYDPTRAEGGQSTDCAYSYPRSSALQPQTGPTVNDRFFNVTVTTSWQVTWIGSGGSAGTLPVLTRSSSSPLAVAQRQTVVTGGSG